ncbi:MAG TPA: hypothetical protein VFA15_06360, partial [Nitrososphaera sp.]|nr:hypothetical protein [Nitrososphaera sp.]
KHMSGKNAPRSSMKITGRQAILFGLVGLLIVVPLIAFLLRVQPEEAPTSSKVSTIYDGEHRDTESVGALFEKNALDRSQNDASTIAHAMRDFATSNDAQEEEIRGRLRQAVVLYFHEEFERSYAECSRCLHAQCDPLRRSSLTYQKTLVTSLLCATALHRSKDAAGFEKELLVCPMDSVERRASIEWLRDGNAVLVKTHKPGNNVQNLIRRLETDQKSNFGN